MNRLLVIGSASYDLLHLQDRSVMAAGGAGAYTALAAARCGARTAMFGPRPEPMPLILRPVARRLAGWLGPVIRPDEMLRFEISYAGGGTEYLDMDVAAELNMSTVTLPTDLALYDLVHITCLGDPQQQLAFLQACRARSARRISAGTYPGGVTEDGDLVRAVMDGSDLFFMNDFEAETLFGSVEAARTEPGKLLFVTRGADGVTVVQGETHTTIPAVAVTQVDPTGAGDTFCGATLAYLLQEMHPLMAAYLAVVLAAEMITRVGPAALLDEGPLPRVFGNGRVRINHERVRGMAEIIGAQQAKQPYDFSGPYYPPVDDPAALDYFFAATLQQFSFWSAENGRYGHPLIAPLDGDELKGSDYLWRAYTRRLASDPDYCTPERQAFTTREEMLELFRSDDGHDPMPAFDLHLEQAQRYGRDMLALDLTPQRIVQMARDSERPLRTFLLLLDAVGGYKEDPLRKKSNLLAMILKARPEAFLAWGEGEEIEPIVDYHLMRSVLRTGALDVLDESLLAKLRKRELLTETEEWAVRYPAYRAINALMAQSPATGTMVDMFLFTNARTCCPEMSIPLCDECLMDPVCAHRTDLFQPAIRTTFY